MRHLHNWPLVNICSIRLPPAIFKLQSEHLLANKTKPQVSDVPSYFPWPTKKFTICFAFLSDLGQFHDAWIVFALQSNGVGAMRRSHVEFLKRVTFTNKPSITVTVNVFCAHVLFANFGQNKFLPQMIMYLLLKLIHQQSSATQWADRCIAKNISLYMFI